MANNIIKTENIKKNYYKNDIVVKAVRGVDLEVKKGEFTAIVGPSGSGKTTFLNVISGLDDPTEGKVWLENKLLSGMSKKELSNFRRDHIGFIFQAFNLIPVLTAEENIEYVMQLQGVPKNERHERVLSILEEMGLKGYHDTLPIHLSGGQQQRVAVARAMVSKPLIIFADEPTANLDSKTSEDLLNNMRELNEETGMTFLFSTHDELVMKRAKRVVVLKDGKIEKDYKK